LTMTTDVFEQYQSAVREFNEKVSELAAKLEQISSARENALRASAELRQELDSCDQRLHDVAGAVRQQVTIELGKRPAASDDVASELSARRAG